MKHLLLMLILATTLYGCASTQNTKVTSKKVGIIVPENHNNNFCYLYRGVTIFNNEHIKEQLSPNFSVSYLAHASDGVRKAGNTPVNLGAIEVEQILEFFVRKEWDHSITPTPAGREYLRELFKSQEVDYVLLPWLHNIRRCMIGVTVGYSDLEYELDSNIQLHLLDSATLAHMRHRQVSSINSTRPTFLPVNKSEPNKNDKNELANRFYKELEDDVYRLLEGDCCYWKRTDLP